MNKRKDAMQTTKHTGKRRCCSGPPREKVGKDTSEDPYSSRQVKTTNINSKQVHQFMRVVDGKSM
jgi:hypothetical protein